MERDLLLSGIVHFKSGALTLPAGAKFALAAGILVLLRQPSEAGTIDWSAIATTTAWSLGTNWDGLVAPANDLTTDIARFDKSSYVFQPNSGTRSISGIRIGDGTTATATLTITNTALSVGGNGLIMFANAGAATLTGGSVKLGADESWANNSSSLLTVNSNITNIGNTTPFTLTLNSSGSGGTTIGGVISNGGATGTTALTINTTGGTTTLSGANTYTGGTTLTAGTLKMSGSGTLGGTGGTLTVNGGTLNLNGTSQSIGNLTGAGGTILNNSTGTNVTFTIGSSNGSGGNYAGVIADNSSGTGTVALTKTGSGTITLSGANTYTGATTISGGTLQLGNGGTSGSLSTSSAIADNGNLTINRSNAVAQGTDFSGNAISGTGSLTQAGSGATTLNAANTYSGGSTISAGTLFVNNNTGSGTGTGSVTVNGSGTLGGSGTISGAVNVSGATINGGGSAGAVGTLRTGALTLSSSSVFSVDMTSTTADQIAVTGTVSITSGSLQLNIPNGIVFTAGQTFTIIDNDSIDGITGTFSNAATGTDSIGGYLWIVSYTGGDGNDFTIQAVPEPGSWAVGALALGAIIWSGRKRVRAFTAFSKTHLICRNSTNNHIIPRHDQHATES